MHSHTLKRIQEDEAFAEKLGFRVLRPAVKSNKYSILLECGVCGHQFPAVFKRNLPDRWDHVKCNECELKEEAKSLGENKGLKFLHEVHNKGGARKFKFLRGDKERVYTIYQLRSDVMPRNEKQVKSKRKLRWKEAIKGKGITVIDEHSFGRKALVLLPCKHEKLLFKSSLLNNQWVCKQCIDEAHQSELGSNIKLIGKTTNTKYLEKPNSYDYYDYTLSCGHTKTSTRSSMAFAENPICEVCEKNYFDLPCYVYMLEIVNEDTKILKLGISRDIIKRVSKYGVKEDTRVNLISANKKNTAREALTLESEIKRKLKDFRLSQEEGKELLVESGYTECFSYECVDTMLRLVNEFPEVYENPSDIVKTVLRAYSA